MSNLKKAKVPSFLTGKLGRVQTQKHNYCFILVFSLVKVVYADTLQNYYPKGILSISGMVPSEWNSEYHGLVLEYAEWRSVQIW